MTPLVVAGVDAGGTSTRALIVDDQGSCRAEHRGGPGNPRSNPDAVRTITQTLTAAIAEADTSPAAVVISVAGLVSLGGRFPELEQEVHRVVGAQTPVAIVTDMHGMYYSATTKPQGTVLICGTGMTVAGIDHHHLRGLRDGLGWLLGDTGSGYWIGREVLRAVASALDGRGPATAMADTVVRSLPSFHAPPHSNDLASLLAWTYDPARRPRDIASHARVALTHPDDDVARRICDDAARNVISTLTSLPAWDAGPVVVGGGIVSTDSPVGQRLQDFLGERMVRTSDGVVGAVMLALAQAGIGDDLRERIAQTRPR